MTQNHDFIFQPGEWVGEGTVSFSSSPDQMFFVTNWNVSPSNGQGIRCEQIVQMEGVEDSVRNHFSLSDITSDKFDIALENEIVGQVTGTGIIDDKSIAWEFQGQLGFQGYEVYELHSDGEYSFHAEYASPDQFRTIIDGRIRRKEG